MTTLPEAIDKIRALRPVLYVGRPGARVGVNYPKGFDDGFNDALEQVDVILASVNQAEPERTPEEWRDHMAEKIAKGVAKARNSKEECRCGGPAIQLSPGPRHLGRCPLFRNSTEADR